ncbi:unnamed protein product [Prorocentrum cordatum]|uniref:Uncharacterized protein n=1 Tax=Prorocentrum cordatum TaxID=2364126 RepID=A0ABN9Y0B5_9DINO|nr:unnamed protein product [Polarella glacialis]
MTSPYHVLIGRGDLPASDLDEALRHGSSEDLHLSFSVRAVGAPIMGDEFCNREGEVIGQAVVCMSACMDEKIMPSRFLPDWGHGDAGAESLPKLGPAAARPNGMGRQT